MTTAGFISLFHDLSIPPPPLLLFIPPFYPSAITTTHRIARSTSQSVAGTTQDVAHRRINLDGIPVVLNDTVGIQQEPPSPSSSQQQQSSSSSSSSSSSLLLHAATMERIDSTDLKVCMLDLEQVYKDKTSGALDPTILNLIDSDTIVLINKRDTVSIRIPQPPSKIRYKNSPLGPQGDVPRHAFRGKVPLRLDGDTEGNSVLYGDFGLRVLTDIRLSDKCLQECRATLFRYIKEVKGGRFWLRILPDHPMTSKPLGVRMGKGKGAFDHWEAKIPNKKILFEVGGGVREEVAREALRAVSARIPGKTEFVVPPVEERVEQVCARIREYSKVKPLGVWCVSSTTGEGMSEFLADLVGLLKKK